MSRNSWKSRVAPAGRVVEDVARGGVDRDAGRSSHCRAVGPACSASVSGWRGAGSSLRPLELFVESWCDDLILRCSAAVAAPGRYVAGRPMDYESRTPRAGVGPVDPGRVGSRSPVCAAGGSKTAVPRLEAAAPGPMAARHLVSGGAAPRHRSSERRAAQRIHIDQATRLGFTVRKPPEERTIPQGAVRSGSGRPTPAAGGGRRFDYANFSCGERRANRFWVTSRRQYLPTFAVCDQMAESWASKGPTLPKLFLVRVRQEWPPPLGVRSGPGLTWCMNGRMRAVCRRPGRRRQ